MRRNEGGEVDDGLQSFARYGHWTQMLLPQWHWTMAVAMLALVLLGLGTDAALADLVWRNGGWVETGGGWGLNSGQTAVQMGLLRVALVAVPTLIGFCIGWLFSEQGREMRETMLALAAIGLGLIVLFNNGTWGWSTASVLAVIGFFLGLGYWIGQAVEALGETPTTFGSAKWADLDHLEDQGILEPGGIRLGEAYDGMTPHGFAYHGDRHLMTYAPTRSGKGVSHIIPNLLTYEGSVLVIDIKGENCLITAQARAEMGQEILAVDPWDIAATKAGIKPARFNPLDWIQLTDPDAPENAMLLADALVQRHEKGDPFWQEEAKAFIQGLILLVAFDATYADKRNLGTVRDLLLLTGEDQMALFQYMAESPHALVASTGARSLQKDPKLMANVLASAQAETHMLDSPRLREALSVSDFDFADLKKMPLSVYLILPADRVETFSKFLRLMVQQSLTVSARNIEDQPAKPVLFILDEMPALGRLTMVEQAYGLMAGFGLQIWGIAQDICQMRRVYGEDHETFIANSGAVAYFGSPDKTTAEYFSGLCGETTVWNFSSALATAFSSSSGSSGPSVSDSTTNTDTRAAAQRKLIYPDELRRMDDEAQLVLIENANPILAHKARWFEDPVLAAKGVNLRTPDIKPLNAEPTA